MNTNAKVMLWGTQVGAVSWLEDKAVGVFQFAPDFLRSQIELAPLKMPLRDHPYQFPALSKETFKGLPGMLADSLPDKFGNAIIDVWLTSQGRAAEDFNPVDRLCYIGSRGMGALQFEPSTLGPTASNTPLQVAQLVDLADRVLAERESLHGYFSQADNREAIEEILRVGTSAGGARAKAVLAWNRETGEFRSGQGDLDIAEGYEHWLMKFDGVTGNRDKELADPAGYGRIEYAYYLMAVQAGIEMSECRLFEEGGRCHFMTRRFDRLPDGTRLHMQSLGALAHYDFNMAGVYSYEQALQVIHQLGLPPEDKRQQVMRAFFNIIARNQDDHVKNIAFLMDRYGVWHLSPAYDVTYAWQPSGAWTSQHQMSTNNKRDHFELDDLIALGRAIDMKVPAIKKGIARITEVVSHWEEFAQEAGVDERTAMRIKKAHRLDII